VGVLNCVCHVARNRDCSGVVRDSPTREDLRDLVGLDCVGDRRDGLSEGHGGVGESDLHQKDKPRKRCSLVGENHRGINVGLGNTALHGDL